MRKLHLKLENLQVESFPVAEERAERGTVQGNQWTGDYNWSCRVDTCSGGMLCECATYEYTYCGTCETVELSYCAAC
jgi:hypothetical protein